MRWQNTQNVCGSVLVTAIQTMADSMAGFDDMSFLPSEAFALGTIAMDGGDEYVRCSKCGFGGCDVRVAPCGCTLHAVRRFVPD